jgi:hypothetical protein
MNRPLIPGARLARKSDGDGDASRLCYMDHVMMKNRNGLVVNVSISSATETAEREESIVRTPAIRARHKQRYKVTTDSRHNLPIAPNLLDRNFNPVTPNSNYR